MIYQHHDLIIPITSYTSVRISYLKGAITLASLLSDVMGDLASDLYTTLTTSGITEPTEVLIPGVVMDGKSPLDLLVYLREFVRIHWYIFENAAGNPELVIEDEKERDDWTGQSAAYKATRTYRHKDDAAGVLAEVRLIDGIYSEEWGGWSDTLLLRDAANRLSGSAISAGVANGSLGSGISGLGMGSPLGGGGSPGAGGLGGGGPTAGDTMHAEYSNWRKGLSGVQLDEPSMAWDGTTTPPFWNTNEVHYLEYSAKGIDN